MTRLVLDTNIVMSALLWGGKPLQIMAIAEARTVSLYTSTTLLNEFARVISREKHREQVAMASGGVAALVADYRAMCTIVSPVALPKPIAPDPDDDWVIATAIAANADLIVTGDKPLLGVGAVGTVRIVSVHDALAQIEAARLP